MLKHRERAHHPYGIEPRGFRLPDETHVGGVQLQVSDIGQSVAYYEQVLGLRTYSATDALAVLGPHGDDRPLVSLYTAPDVTRARRGAFGLYHFAILLPHRSALGSFAAHISALGLPVGTADHFVSEAIYLWDPDGLGIEVYADRPRTAWDHHDRELVMTTEPLDVDALIAVAGDRRWEGMPPGTTMGHVHLHVGSLEEAEAFYHSALGFDKMVWSYPGALFFAAGGYHHHLGTNVWGSGPRARDHEARLLEWQLVVADSDDVRAAAQSLDARGYAATDTVDGLIAADPWGTRLRIVSGSVRL